VCGGKLVRAPVEMLETYYPWHITRYELITDSGGVGAWRGGLGIHWEATNIGSPAILLTGDSDGDITRGYTVLGGHPPAAFNRLTLTAPTGEITQVRAHRQSVAQTGDVLIQRTAGGCGAGDPRTRDANAVLKDVINEYVSLERARHEYGVVIDPATMRLDEAATAAMRAAAR
jgi:N-methylhydantoinase B